MINKWFNYLLSVPLITFNVIMTTSIQKQVLDYEPWFPSTYINSDWRNIYYSNFIVASRSGWDEFDTLAKDNNVNLGHNRNFKEKYAGNGVEYSWGYQTITQINFRNYASDKNSFLKNYHLRIDFDLSANAWTSDGYWWSNNISGSDGTNLRFQSQNHYYQIPYSNQESKYREYTDHDRKTNSEIWFKFNWSEDRLLFQIKLQTKVWWNWGSSIGHASIISFKLNYLEITSQFSEQKFKNDLQQGFSNPFTLNTKTSPLINSDDTLSVDGPTTSNKNIINQEIERRLKSILNNNYYEWIKRLSIEKQYLIDQNVVKLTFIDAQNQVPSKIKELFKDLFLHVKVNLLPQFFQKSLKERLQIVPGKIVNPNNSENQLITDNPEFIKNGNQEIYIYHNAVKLTFSSNTNSGEILFVNGKEVQVYNNIFATELLDNGSSEEKDNTYQIVIKQKQVERMKLTIKISTQGQDTTFKWLGWDPQNDSSKPNEYKQYKLITETINGKENEEYDPTINPQTGLRNQMIFVNKKSDYPFPLNPLDKFGRLIKDNKNNYIQGYIAEAMVANSGIQNIFNEQDLKTIAKIDRVQINPKTFEPLQNSHIVNVTNEMQFSLPGLWHYIYHIKDYVNVKVDPKETNSRSILAQSGSTMHKFVLIGNQLGDYAEFLKQKDIFNNRDLEYFWSSIAGKHLKSFLKNERQINLTTQISQLEYKQVIRYWKEYVSSAVKEQIDRKDEFELFDLTTLKLNALRINTNNRKVFIQELINYLKNTLKKFSPESEYENDYYVTNDLAENLNQINFQDFLTINEQDKIKKFQLIIASTNQSLFIKGKTKLTIINDYKYDEKKLLDLNKLKMRDISYNFFASSDKIKESFKNSYILNYINNFLIKQKPKNIKNIYMHKIDYEIFVEFPDRRKINIIDKKIDELLKLFLKTEKYQSLNIEIVSIKQSYLLIGQTNYKITNDPDGIIAPPDPKIDDKDEQQLIKNLMWIIPTTIGAIIIIGLTSFFVIKRFKRKIK